MGAVGHSTIKAKYVTGHLSYRATRSYHSTVKTKNKRTSISRMVTKNDCLSLFISPNKDLNLSFSQESIGGISKSLIVISLGL